MHSHCNFQLLQLNYSCCAQIALFLCAIATLSVKGEEGECSSRGLYEGEFFPGVGKIQYEGAESTNPLSFHYYNADELIMGKPMKEWWVCCLPCMSRPLSTPCTIRPSITSLTQTLREVRSHPHTFPQCRLRFSVAFWHTMRGDGSDPFGSGTKVACICL